MSGEPPGRFESPAFLLPEDTMTRFADTLFSRSLSAATLAAAAITLAAPAWATTDPTRYPTAVAGDAAEVMAKYGGVVIDVETLFPGENRALNFLGCGVHKRDHTPDVSADEEQYQFTRCAPTIGAEQILPPYVPPLDIIQSPRETVIRPFYPTDDDLPQ
jgi:hypothetical protein